MHLLVKGQSEEKRRRSPLLPSQSLRALLMATKGFGVKEGVTWYMLGNTLLAEGGGYPFGKKGEKKSHGRKLQL